MTPLVRTFAYGLVGLDYSDGPLEALFAAAQARGCPWIEPYYDVNLTLDDVIRARDLCARHGVRIVSVSSLAKINQAEEDLPAHAALVEASIAAAAALDAPFATFMYGGNQALDREAARERFVRRMRPLIRRAQDAGIMLLLENVFSRQPSGDLDTVEETLAVFRALDSDVMGLNFDAGNYAIGGEEGYPRALFALWPYIRYAHLKDVARYDAALHGPMGGRRALLDHQRGPHLSVPLGQGALNCYGLLRGLASQGFEGVLALEPFAHGAEREHWLDEASAFLTKVGFSI
jgi:sugar phosphate isomerase/epimerase